MAFDGGGQQFARPRGVAALECGCAGLEQFFAFALPLGDGAAGAFDVGAGARVRTIQEEDAGPDADCELVPSAEIMIESGVEQLLDSR